MGPGHAAEDRDAVNDEPAPEEEDPDSGELMRGHDDYSQPESTSLPALDSDPPLRHPVDRLRLRLHAGVVGFPGVPAAERGGGVLRRAALSEGAIAE